MAYLDKIKVGDTTYDIQDSNLSPLGVTAFTGQSTTSKGITFSWDGNNCTVNGTSTAATWFDLIPRNTIPDWLEPGAKYQVYFQSSNPNVRLTLYYTVDNGQNWQEVFATTTNIPSVTIPANATGFLLRIHLTSGTVADNVTVTPVFVKLNDQSPLIPRQDLIRSLPFNYTVNAGEYTSCDEVNKNSVIFNSSNGSSSTFPDFPFGSTEPGWLITLSSKPNNTTLLLQFAIMWNAPNKMMMRAHSFTAWTDWREVTQDLDIKSHFKNLQVTRSYTSCDDVTETCALFVSSSGGVKTIPDYPIDDAGWLLTYPAATLNLQFAVGYGNGEVMIRRKLASGWTSWTQPGITSYLPGCDLDTLVNGNHFYLLVDSQEYENMPLSSIKAGFLEIKQSANWCKQFFYALNEGKSWVRTFSNGAKRTDWVLSEGGNGNTYNVTQEISRDTYQNTYTITTSPQITTNSNGWLQAIDNESTDEANATDMTGPIMAMLNSTGYCKLGPGTFYVSGNINMPNNAMLEGCGNKTIVRLLSSVTSGYIVRLTQYNTVKDIRFSGGKSVPANLYTDGTNLGSRHGIYLIANADKKEDAQPQALQNFITNCFFDNFDGSAFYTHNTGGGLQNSVTFTDSYITLCRVGINIDYYAEYGKYSQIIISQCYYACINNGGNNVFMGCTFHGVVGWLTDNSGNDKKNNQHGSCIGCTFNHLDNMNNPSVLGNGKAVHIINGVNGFIFTGCQLWYGNVYIENSKGIQFSDCLFGNNAIEIQVTGSYPAFFFDNIFWTAPTLDVISSCKFEGNHLQSGATVQP